MSALQVSIVTFDNVGTIDACIESVLRETRGWDARIDVVDNRSGDGTAGHVLERFHGVRVERLEHNVGFGAAHNRVLRNCAAPLGLLLNPDAQLGEGALAALAARLAAEPRTALVGPRVTYDDGTPQVSFGPFPGPFADLRQRRLVRGCRARNPRVAREVARRLARPFHPDWVSGSCVLGQVAALREVGGFDESFFLYMEDVDLCKRLRDAGWDVAVEPAATCVHREGGSPLDDAERRRLRRGGRRLWARKHGSWWWPLTRIIHEGHD